VACSHVSMKVVVKSLEKTISQVHVTDGVNVLKLNRAGDLTKSVSPVVLNALHVPLVDYDHDAFTLGILNLLEQIFVPLINKDRL